MSSIYISKCLLRLDAMNGSQEDNILKDGTKGRGKYYTALHEVEERAHWCSQKVEQHQDRTQDGVSLSLHAL